MTPSSEDDDFHTIVISKCLELTKMLGSKGMAYSFKLTFGDSFCFSLDTMGARTQPVPVPVKKKKKSESAKRRDKKRRMEFLSRKKTVSSPDALLPVLPCSLASPRADSHSPVTPGAEALQKDTLDTNRSENCVCLCGALPCICDACHPLPKDDHHVPKIMLRKSASGWASTPTSDHPVSSSPTLSNAPVCQNCSHAFLDASHQCDTDKDDTLSQSNDTSGGEVFQDNDMLDLQACKDLVFSDLHTADEKHSILKKNCTAMMELVPIDLPTARFCFSYAQYFKLRRDDLTLGYTMNNLINNVFNPQFDKEVSKLG